jgi:hypothetical protein
MARSCPKINFGTAPKNFGNYLEAAELEYRLNTTFPPEV